MADLSQHDDIAKLSLSSLTSRSVNLFLGCKRLQLLKLAREGFNSNTFNIYNSITTESSAAAWASAMYVLTDKTNIQSVFGKNASMLHKGRIAEASLHVMLREEPDELPKNCQWTQLPGQDVLLEQRRRLERFLFRWEQAVLAARKASNTTLADVELSAKDQDKNPSQVDLAVAALRAVVDGGLQSVLTVADGASSVQKCNAIMNDWLDRRNDDEIMGWSQEMWVDKLQKQGHRFSKKTVAATAKLDTEPINRRAWARIMQFRKGAKNEFLVSKETAE